MRFIKKLLPLFLVAIILSGYLIYTGKFPVNSRVFTPKSLSSISETSEASTQILGAATQTAKDKIIDYYQEITGNQEEALINNMVENITKQLKGLPENQAKKIKYQFCQDIITEVDPDQ